MHQIRYLHPLKEFSATSELSATTSEEVANTIEEIARGASNQAQDAEKELILWKS